MVFYGGFETHDILPSFETHGILRRFLNPWYLTRVLKEFFLGLKKLGEHVPQGWFSRGNCNHE